MKKFSLSFFNSKQLRYGENPHQKGWAWREKTQDSLAYFKFEQIQGRELSFNNYLDIDAAVNCLSFIGQKLPACVVVKHTNPCGASVNRDIKKAFIRAWKGDSLAAFGGVIAVNRAVGVQLAKLMLANKKFFEVLLCPGIRAETRKIFTVKKSLRILVNPALRKPKPAKDFDFKKIRGGFLVQEADSAALDEKKLKVVTKKKPSKKQIRDLLFAWAVCRNCKSNSIVLAKNQTLVSAGVGQQDRLRCCQLAVSKAGGKAKNSMAASDGFFPFPDGPEILIKAGVKAIIQPGGSIRDQKTIDLCNRHNVAMVFTGLRCFRH